MSSRNELRQQIRERRRQLDSLDRHACSLQLVRQLTKHPFFYRSQNIACYLASDGEQELSPVIERIWSMGKVCYLPVLNGLHGDSMMFAPFAEGDSLMMNRYGIPEPVTNKRFLVNGQCLDLVLMPLVAFDEAGNRLGMGGGYYDRTFSFLKHRRCWFRPRLVGVAYEFQKVHKLDSCDWDIPMHAVVTEDRLKIVR